jgi:hypothetical protein
MTEWQQDPRVKTPGKIALTLHKLGGLTMALLIRLSIQLRYWRAYRHADSALERGNLRLQRDFRLNFALSGDTAMRRFKFRCRYSRYYQLQLLRQILQQQAQTVFGREHGFADIESLRQYREQVQLQDYETLRPYIQRHLQGEADVLLQGKPCYYATTSGSTGEPKFIPVTRAQQQSAHQDAARLWGYSLQQNHPRAFAGKSLVIVSPAVEGHAPDGTPFGSISGQYIQDLDEAIKHKYLLPYAVYCIKDYDARYYSILRLGMAAADVSLVSSTNPSTLSLLAEKGVLWQDMLLDDLAHGGINSQFALEPEIRAVLLPLCQANPQRAAALRALQQQDPEQRLRPYHYWPQLAVIACWTGGNSAFFLQKMQQWYGQVHIKDLGFLASEIRGSIPLALDQSAGLLTIEDNFFEFARVNDVQQGDFPPEQRQYLLADELCAGERYYLYFSNIAGLYRYDLNDIIEVKGFHGTTPLIDFVQKGKGVTNITGEKIYEQQVLAAVAAAQQQTSLHCVFFQCLASAPQGGYQLFAEFSQPPAPQDLVLFASAFEQALQQQNIEYRSKRLSQRLAPVQVHALASGSLEQFKRRRVAAGVREAQFKTVPLTADASLSTEFVIISSTAAKENQYVA